ncbi:hypothetical protein ABF162_25445 (plasmid) [Vibrio coralliilyticus]|nr:hypothetical protein [Vibrio coralliilyticus]
MDTLLAIFNQMTQASTESLIVFVVLCSMGFSYLIIKMVLNTISGKGGDE